MEYDKEILTFEEQLELLEERGLLIENVSQNQIREECKEFIIS